VPEGRYIVQRIMARNNETDREPRSPVASAARVLQNAVC
jgi:hypothetical protein